MQDKLSYIVPSLVGIVFGVAANSSALLGRWENLIVWAVVGILIGLFIERARFVNRSGVLYGVFLTLAFLISGFQGAASALPGFAVLCAILGVVGAVCGWALVASANWAKMKLRGKE